MMNNEIYKKKYNPYLPNIRYGAQYGNSFNNNNNYSKEKYNSRNYKLNDEKINYDNNKNSFLFTNDDEENNNINEQLTNRSNNKDLLNKKNEHNYNNNILPNVFKSEEKAKENPFLRKNNSSNDLVSKKLSINNSYENKSADLSNFIAKLKITKFYSTSEIILLIENIISELNLKKDYTFSIKDNSMSFIFNDAEQALSIFKQINIEKLKNKYYQNLTVDIKFEVNKEKEEGKNVIKEIVNEEIKNQQIGNKKMKLKTKRIKLLPSKTKNNIQEKKLESFKNLKTYNYSKDNLFTNKISDKYFEEVYKNYREYFKHRKEERRKRELNYQNGKDISLLASTPYVENNSKKSFFENLRSNGGNDIAPSKFNGYIDKASVKKYNYNDNHLYLVPDFINHWKLREDNKKKWICPAKFQV